MHDVLDDRDLIPDEAEQLVTSGHQAGPLLEQARAAARADDLPRLAEIEDRLAAAPRDPGWRYHEPGADELAALLPAPTPTAPLDLADLADRQYGAWLGRCVGNTMGKPVEGLTAAEVETYLRAAGAWPQQGFVPLLDQLPPGVSHLHESAPLAAQGRFKAVPRDDDLDWTLLGLHVLETYGDAVGASYEEARAWLDARTGQYNWVHTLSNAGIIAVALLWGEEDFVTTIARSVAAGLDTDSNAATVGSVFGALHGAAAVPAGLRAAGGERLSSAVAGFDGIEIAKLAERSLRLAERAAAEVTR